MLAYVSNSLRRVTLALFSPKPTGVSSGPLRATRERARESMVSCGTPVGRPFLNTSAPASCSSHSIGAPVASTMRRADVATSGPMPSPAIRVTSLLVSVMLGTLTDAESAQPRLPPPLRKGQLVLDLALLGPREGLLELREVGADVRHPDGLHHAAGGGVDRHRLGDHPLDADGRERVLEQRARRLRRDPLAP